MIRLFLLLIACSFSNLLFGQILIENINTTPNEPASSFPQNWVAVDNEHIIYKATIEVNSGTRYAYATNINDLNTRFVDSVTVTSNMISFNGKVFFNGCDLSYNDPCFELYAINGADGNAGLFKKLSNSPLASDPEDFIAGENLFFFEALGIFTGRALWCSDGTPENTRILGTVIPYLSAQSNIDAKIFDDVLYFNGYTLDKGLEPWRSDGTEEGTYRIADIYPGQDHSNPRNFTKAGDYIYFTALDTAGNRDLIRYDLLLDTVINLSEIDSFGLTGSVYNLINSSDRLFFNTSGPGHGYDNRAFWTLNPNEIPSIIDSTTLIPRRMFPFGDGELLFTSDANGLGDELYRTDGTPAGTQLVKDINPGNGDGIRISNNSNPDPYAVVGDSLLYFAGNDGIHGWELFVSDGTEAGTQLAGETWPGSGDGNPKRFFVHQDKLFFEGSAPGIGSEPFVLDLNLMTSISNPLNSEQVNLVQTVFPNPILRGDHLKMRIKLNQSSTIKAQFFTLLGQSSTQVIDLGQYPAGEQVVDFGNINLPTGFYMLQVMLDETRTSIKVQIE
ncbi:MAG: hypothetical protein AAF741_02425 [Bacteroidota bacterium]